ncbi:AGE family epimerase/isomerase [Aliikangiella sp. IMCC44359]|uniref:AGE family epimerase/isomerase n=1 Tax=Aliikangiella sp. IMCC44359 TaxID=3459125 RepID=UPI00403A7ECE
MKKPIFDSPTFLREHIKSTMAFYDPICLDKKGGFYHYFNDQGEVYNKSSRHLVSSARFVFNYAMAAVEYKNEDYLKRAQHGLDYLNYFHFNLTSGSYLWERDSERVLDDTNHAYGLAFVLLANAVSLKAGIDTNKTIEATWQHLEENFWESKFGLYKDELNINLTPISNYRGQNANMHLCEAMLMTYEATHNQRYLDRAYTIAKNILQLSQQSNGLIWEHYNHHWKIDWDYNRDNPKHLFRPWGFQPGHQIEWAKLLLILHRHKPEHWMIESACSFFDRTIKLSWDPQYQGIFYGFDPNYKTCDSDKYYWVQAEAIAAAAMLAITTGNSDYWDWYIRIWQYVWEHFVDHQYGAWYRILSKNNQKYDNLKSPAGKTDYHTMGACYEVLNTMRLHDQVNEQNAKANNFSGNAL